MSWSRSASGTSKTAVSDALAAQASPDDPHQRAQFEATVGAVVSLLNVVDGDQYTVSVGGHAGGGGADSVFVQLSTQRATPAS